jgi:peptide/nickel transport system substrate-binding protein
MEYRNQRRRSPFALTRRRSARSMIVLLALGATAGLCSLQYRLAAQNGTVVRIGAAFPRAGIQGTGLSQIAQSLTAEALVSLRHDGRPVPHLAQRWSQSADGLTWTFVVKPGAKFQNGAPATAAAIAEQVQAAASTTVLRRFYTQLPDVLSVEASSADHLVIRTAHRRALLLDDFADMRFGGAKEETALGPFVVRSISEEELIARAFRAHFQGPPLIDEVRLRSYKTLRSAWVALMRGEIDALYQVNREAVEFVERENTVRLYRFLRPYVAHLMFNVNRPPLRDPSVRRALSQAVNRDAIVERAYRGAARPAEGPLWPDHWALGSDLPRFSYDPRAAAATLDERPMDSSAVSGRMPARVRFTCLVPEIEMQPMEQMALLLQKQLYSVGVDMQLEPVSLQEAMARAFAGQFDAILFEFAARTPGWLYAMWHSAAPEDTFAVRNGYSAADRELEALRDASNDDGVRSALRSVYRKMYEDPPAIFIAWPTVSRAVSTDFQIDVEEGADVMGPNIRLWRPVDRQDSPR